jgi:hypothetical protein
MRPDAKAFFKMSLAVLAWLLVFDLALNGLGQAAARSGGAWVSLARYLEYGRSVEGKLTQLIGRDGQGANAIVSAGWLDPAQWAGKPTQASDEKHTLVAVYGQSFAIQVATQAARSNPGWQLRTIGGPAAPLSHSYAAYQLDKDQRKAQVVVVGILASALGRSSSMSGLSFTFESPAPFTFPRYTLSAQGLQAHWPALSTEAQFRKAFADKGDAWAKFERELLAVNPAMDRFQFQGGWGDASALVRLARRGWVSARAAELKAAAHGEQGLARDLLAEVDVAKAQLLSLQRDTASRGEKLVILLLQDQGYDRALTQVFADFFQTHGIAVVDSSDVINSRNPGNFLPDGHFTASCNAKLAEALISALRR